MISSPMSSWRSISASRSAAARSLFAASSRRTVARASSSTRSTSSRARVSASTDSTRSRPLAANETSEPPIPAAPTICAAVRVAAARSEAGPVVVSPKNSSSATQPPIAIWTSARRSSRVCV